MFKINMVVFFDKHKLPEYFFRIDHISFVFIVKKDNNGSCLFFMNLSFCIDIVDVQLTEVNQQTGPKSTPLQRLEEQNRLLEAERELRGNAPLTRPELGPLALVHSITCTREKKLQKQQTYRSLISYCSIPVFDIKNVSLII